MKRLAALFLSAVLMFGVLAPGAYAADASSTAGTPRAVTLAFESTGGAIASLLSRVLKLVTFTDESRIKKAASRDAA